MTPFSCFFQGLRKKRAIRQADLARMLGYDQSYVSALELGIKGPPTDEFVERLETVLELSEAERTEMRTAARASHRKFLIEVDSPIEIYWMVDKLRRHIGRLRPEQIQVIDHVLEMTDSFKDPPLVPPRIRRRSREEVTM